MRFFARLLISLSVVLLIVRLSAAEPTPGELFPLAFEQNVGQHSDGVRFLLRGGNRGALFFDDRAVFAAGNADGSTAATMSWVGGSGAAISEGVDRTATVTHYYVGDDPSQWLHGVPSFERIRYVGAYPGIDLEFYHSEGELEYDFILSPGADSSQIQLSFGGDAEPQLTESGSLLFAGAEGVIEHRKPTIFQIVDGERRLVDGAFVVVGEREIRFQVGEYDRELALVVDPKIGFASYVGRGSDRETISAVVQAVNGDLIAVGTTWSLDDFAGLAPISRPAGANGFVVRMRGSDTFPQTFEPVEVVIVGGSGDDSINDVIESPSGFLLGGTTDSPDFPFGTPFGGSDMFVTHWTNGGGVDNGVRFGDTVDDIFEEFARRNMLGVPQASVYDYDGAGLSFFTKGKISAGVGEFIQVRQWGMDTLTPWRELQLLAQSAETTIETSNLEWSEDRRSLVIAGSANNSLFPAAAHSGSPGTFRPFLAEIPIEGPSSTTAPQAIEDVFFFDWVTAGPDDETHVSGLALSPAPDPFFDGVSGRVSAFSSLSIGDRGQVFMFEEEYLATSDSFTSTNDVPAIRATRRLDYAFAVETIAGGGLAGQKRGLVRVESSEGYDGSLSFSNQYSFENEIAGAAMAANGRDVIVFWSGRPVDDEFRIADGKRTSRWLAGAGGVFQPLPRRDRDGRPIQVGTASSLWHLHDLP